MDMDQDNFERTVVITGGSGFIGTHLVSNLLARGCTVVSIDTKPPADANHKPFWRAIDLLDKEAVAACIAEAAPGIIYNLAAYAALGGGMDEMKVNTEGCNNIIAACDALHERPLIVHTSTQLVVGPGHRVSGPTDFQPYTPYGETKADSERIFHGLPASVRWTIVRPTTVWGPGHPSFAGQIWKYIGKGLYLHPAGKPIVRSYGYVDNVVHQLIRIGELPAAAVEGKTFYVGDAPMPSSAWVDAFSQAMRGHPARRVPYAVLKAAAAVGEFLGKVGGPSPINNGRLYRMTTDYGVPMQETLDVLGAGPVDLDEGVRRTMAWLQARNGK